jgi:hypothetical protein
VQGKLDGTIQSGGDAAGAADWLCFTSNAGDPPVIYWFISNREMGGGLVTEVAIQTNNNGVSSGCGKALAILSKIDLGIPSIGSGQRDVATHFASGRIKDGIMSYASERPQGRSLRDALGFRAFNIGSKTSW